MVKIVMSNGITFEVSQAQALVIAEFVLQTVCANTTVEECVAPDEEYSYQMAV